jgi:hypothetical protein
MDCQELNSSYLEISIGGCMGDRRAEMILRNIVGATAGAFGSQDAKLLHHHVSHLFPGLGSILYSEGLNYLEMAQKIGRMAADGMRGTAYRSRGACDIEVLADCWNSSRCIYMAVEGHDNYGLLKTMFCPEKDFAYWP